MSQPSFRPRRSLLYVPASNAKALAKARTLNSDGVILDLEDAVAPELKDSARATAVQLVRERAFGTRETIVRINAHDTPWAREDCAALAAADVDALLAPKINGAEDVQIYTQWLADAPPSTALWTMIETARSFLQLREIAALQSSTRLACWVIGTNDLAKEMRAPLTPERTPFLPMLGQAVLAARAYGLAILDGVYNELDDEAGFAAQCAQAAAYGFDGKTLIHPKQIAPCHQAFTPNEAALAQAREIVAAFALPENRERGAIRVAGRMTERLHLAEAEQLLALHAMMVAAQT